MTPLRVLFCTSFAADVQIQLPLMRWFRARGEEVRVLSLRLNYGYDPGRSLLEAAGFEYRALEEGDLPFFSAATDGYGKHFVASRLVDAPAERSALDPELCALLEERVTLFRRRKAQFETAHGAMSWHSLCGDPPDAVFLCASLQRYFWVIEAARQARIPTFNYWHGLMHPPTFRTPHEYWWVNHPLVWGENQIAGYAGCGCPPEKLRAQSPARYINWTPRGRKPGLLPAGRPTVLINGQSCDPSTPFWAFPDEARVSRWLTDIAAALHDTDVNILYKEHPRNERRFEPEVQRLFGGFPVLRFVLNEVGWEEIAAEADAAIMLASSTALDLLLEGVPLICYEPFEYEIAGWRWHRGLTAYGAAEAVENAAELGPALRRLLSRSRAGHAGAAANTAPLDALLANRTPAAFEAFMERNRRLIGSAGIRRAGAAAPPPDADAPLLLLNDTEANNHAGCALTMRGLKALCTARFPARKLVTWPVQKTWGFKHSPRSLEEMQALLQSSDPAVQELATAIRGSARVIINGEGTFFGARNETFALLFFAYAATALGRPCAMINNSFSTLGMSEAEADLCRVVLLAIDDFAVRDAFNFHRLRDAGFPCRLSADALYLGAWPRIEALQQRSRGAANRVLISGSVLFSAAPEQVAAAVRAQSRMAAELFPPRSHQYMVLARGSIEERILKPVADDLGVTLTRQADLEADALIDFIYDCRAVISGRYHYNMLAGLAGVPFVPLDSNNSKMRGLCEDLRYPLAPLGYEVDAATGVGSMLERIVAEEAALRASLVAARPRLLERAHLALAPGWCEASPGTSAVAK